MPTKCHSCASPWARWQSEREVDAVTNLYMVDVRVTPITRHLVPQLDGSHSHADLVEFCLQSVAEDGVVIEKSGQPITDPIELRDVLRQGLKVHLQALARSGLLIH